MTSQRDRAATAATAVERLAASLSNGVEDDDSITVAYLMRLLEAAARVEEYAAYGLRNVSPDRNYLGRLADSRLRTSAEGFGAGT